MSKDDTNQAQAKPLIEIGGVGTHVVLRPSKGVIIFFADADGFLHPDMKFVREYFAARDFTVLGFDYFGGEPSKRPPKEPHAEYEKWALEQQERIKKVLPAWLKAVYDRYSSQTEDVHFFAYGFGFGAPFALEECVSSNQYIQAGAVVHPEFIDTTHIVNIEKPISFTFTNTNNASDHKVKSWAESILSGPKHKPKTKYCMQTFATDLPEVHPGQDPVAENENYAVHESTRSISEWFIRASEIKRGPQ